MSTTGHSGTTTGDFELIPLTFPQVSQFWGTFSGWVERVRSKTKAPWRVEDVYAEIKEGRAVAYVPVWKGVPSGLLVLVDQTDPITRVRTLAMWVAFSAVSEVVDLTLDRVEEMARRGGFSAVTGMSPRKGWLRRLAPRGYNLVAYCFEKEIR